MKNNNKNSQSSINTYIKVVIMIVFVIIVTIVPLLFLKCSGEDVSLYSYVMLIFTILTFCATIMMSVIVYKLGVIREKNKYDENVRKAKISILYSLKELLSSIIMYYYDENNELVNSDLSFILELYSSEISLALPEKQRGTLVKIANEFKRFKESIDDEGVFDAANRFYFVFKPWIGVLYCTSYREYFSLIRDHNDVFSREILDLLSELSDKKFDYDANMNIMSVEGDVLFSYDNSTEFTTVNNIGEVLLNGELDCNEFDDLKIKNGFEKSEEYEGYYRDFKYHGEGCRYNHNHQKLEEGYWENGILLKGKKYNCVIKLSDDGKNAEELFQFYDDWHYHNGSDRLLDIIQETHSFDGIMYADYDAESEMFINEIPFEQFLRKLDDDSSFVKFLKSQTKR